MSDLEIQPGPSDPDRWVDWAPSEPISSPPTAQALDWVERELRSMVIDVIALPGGLSSAIHRLELIDGRVVVLRRHVNEDWLAREPDIPRDEAEILSLLPTLGLPMATPTLIAADPEGKVAGAPAILMSEVPGRPELDPDEPGEWADRLAECLASVHAVDPEPLTDRLGSWKRWDSPERPLPIWTEEPKLWEQALEEVPTELPVIEARFLHRDFHPNNVHWSGGNLVAVVDWLGACLGEPAADLAHCRWNLAVLTSPELAMQFTWRYREVSGYEVDTTPWDLATVLSAPVGPFPVSAWHALGRTDLTSDEVAGRIDAWLAHLLLD